MKCKISVTFEYMTRRPETWRGEVEATAPWTAINRAVKQAAREIRPRNWSSMVAVIIEREGDEAESEETAEVSETSI